MTLIEDLTTGGRISLDDETKLETTRWVRSGWRRSIKIKITSQQINFQQILVIRELVKPSLVLATPLLPKLAACSHIVVPRATRREAVAQPVEVLVSFKVVDLGLSRLAVVFLGHAPTVFLSALH